MRSVNEWIHRPSIASTANGFDLCHRTSCRSSSGSSRVSWTAACYSDVQFMWHNATTQNFIVRWVAADRRRRFNGSWVAVAQQQQQQQRSSEDASDWGDDSATCRHKDGFLADVLTDAVKTPGTVVRILSAFCHHSREGHLIRIRNRRNRDWIDCLRWTTVKFRSYLLNYLFLQLIASRSSNGGKTLTGFLKMSVVFASGSLKRLQLSLATHGDILIYQRRRGCGCGSDDDVINQSSLSRRHPSPSSSVRMCTSRDIHSATRSFDSGARSRRRSRWWRQKFVRYVQKEPYLERTQVAATAADLRPFRIGRRLRAFRSMSSAWHRRRPRQKCANGRRNA